MPPSPLFLFLFGGSSSVPPLRSVKKRRRAVAAASSTFGRHPRESSSLPPPVPYSSQDSKPSNPSWSKMFQSASLRRSLDFLPPSSPHLPESSPDGDPPKPSVASGTVVGGPLNASSYTVGTLSSNPHTRLALYISMAHTGLALSLLLLYGLYRLLHDFLRPLQWAILCSIPLHRLQDALVSFWSSLLRLDLLPTLLAIPSTLLHASAATLVDFRSILLRRKLVSSSSTSTLGFSRLLRWLVSF